MARRHCWEDKATHIHEEEGYSDAWAEAFEHGATCMLWDEHEGPHEWTPDSQIGVSFGEPTPEPATNELED